MTRNAADVPERLIHAIFPGWGTFEVQPEGLEALKRTAKDRGVEVYILRLVRKETRQ